MKFTVHTIVKNEDLWVGFAIKSVLPFAEKVFVFDTGSSDKTVEVIKSLSSSKIVFEDKGNQDKKGLRKLREEQLKRTETEWFLIVDGDEIWPTKNIQQVILAAQQAPTSIKGIVNQTRNCVGDVYHFLPPAAGRYHLAGQTGHLTMRMMRKTADLHLSGSYPLESFVDKNGPLEKQEDSLLYVDTWYLHTTFLKRSSQASSKVSGSFGKKKLWEKGLIMKEQELPEVLFEKATQLPPGPLKKRGKIYEVLAQLTTPVLTVKRNFR